ncbi:MAG TPA: DUF2946 family protein [Hyphomonadaceae bacterium]|nr:DUF2946 family protein [Hyphomonadaceae bacterium]
MTGALAARMNAFVLAWLCAFAIAFQCIIAPAHIHTRAADLAVASAPAAAAADNATQKAELPSKQRPADDTQSHCFICQQMAIAGAAILPDSPTPILIHRDLSVAAPAIEIVTVSLRPSHIWRSRAPPLSLQA